MPLRRGRGTPRVLARRLKVERSGTHKFQPEQADDGADQALSLTQRQVEHGREREGGQDGQGRIPGLATRCGARRCPPALNRRVREPHYEAAELA